MRGFTSIRADRDLFGGEKAAAHRVLQDASEFIHASAIAATPAVASAKADFGALCRFRRVCAGRIRRSILWLIVSRTVQKLLITLAILVVFIVTMLASWIFGGRQLSLFIDRFGTIETSSAPIKSIAYEGSGTGGWLRVNDLALGLNDTGPKIAPSLGSTKDNQFALANGGKVFAFGPLASTGENGGDYLAAMPQAGDEALLVKRHSIVCWPTPFDINFISGESPTWKRHNYYQVRWKKPSGATLDMLWRYEQYFYPRNGWAAGFMMRSSSTGLVRLEIHP